MDRSYPMQIIRDNHKKELAKAKRQGAIEALEKVRRKIKRERNNKDRFVIAIDGIPAEEISVSAFINREIERLREKED